jgi:hypothetical protein
MLLLGEHTPTDGGSRKFLLQNWWPQKQFIECSERYLVACGAQAVFVRDSSMISDTLPLLDGIWAEAVDVDLEEAYDPEG